MGAESTVRASQGSGVQASAQQLGRADRDHGERLLRFLSRLSRFGLAADGQPLLRAAKPGL